MECFEFIKMSVGVCILHSGAHSNPPFAPLYWIGICSLLHFSPHSLWNTKRLLCRNPFRFISKPCWGCLQCTMNQWRLLLTGDDDSADHILALATLFRKDVLDLGLFLKLMTVWRIHNAALLLVKAFMLLMSCDFPLYCSTVFCALNCWGPKDTVTILSLSLHVNFSVTYSHSAKMPVYSNNAVQGRVIVTVQICGFQTF